MASDKSTVGLRLTDQGMEWVVERAYGGLSYAAVCREALAFIASSKTLTIKFDDHLEAKRRTF